MYTWYNRTSCAQAHELPQSHCGDNRRAHYFHSCKYIYIYIYMYIYIYIYDIYYIIYIYIYIYTHIYDKEYYFFRNNLQPIELQQSNLVEYNVFVFEMTSQPSTHTTDKSFTQLLPTKVKHATVLTKQTALYKKNAWAKTHYIKQILARKTCKQKFITAYQKQNLKQDIHTIKNFSTTKSTKMKRNCQRASISVKHFGTISTIQC